MEAHALPVLVLASVTAGAGKTTLACAIETALRQHKHNVKTFVVGTGLNECVPPAAPPLHAAVWDSASAHEFQKQQPPGLDVALHGSTDALAAALLGMSADAQLALVRARGGLFDDGGSSSGGTADGASSSGSGDVGASSSAGGGSDSDGETPNDGTEGGAGLQRLSSAAHVAQALHAPLVLVVDGSTFASVRAVVALLKGCSALLHGTCIGGLLLNRSGCSATAPRQLRRAMDAAGLRGTVLLGGLPKLESDAMSDEQQLATAAATHVDLLALQALAARAAVPTPAAPLLLPPARSYRAAVGLAMDAAFYRYFQQNLQMLYGAGVQLVPFSPLTDRGLPPGLSALLLGGGPVQDWAGVLSTNEPMLAALRAFARAGGLVFGEGEALMYLAVSLRHPGGVRTQMAGLLPIHTHALELNADACTGTYSTSAAPAYMHVQVSGVPHALLLPGCEARGVAACCCHVVEEHLPGGLATALLGEVNGHARKQQQDVQQGDHIRSSNGCSSSFAGGCSDNISSSAATGVAFSPLLHSYACEPLVQRSVCTAPVAEGYTCGGVFGSCVQIAYCSCPQLPAHIAKRCLRVDVASASVAASAAAAEAASAIADVTAAELPPRGSSAGAVRAADGEVGGATTLAAVLSGRIASAPDLPAILRRQQQMQELETTTPLLPQHDGEVHGGRHSAGEDGNSSACAAPAAGPRVRPVGSLSPARKSTSIPANMHQLALQQQQQQLAPPHLLKVLGSGGGGTVQQWTPLAVPKRWSLELQRLGNSLTGQLLPAARSPGNSTTGQLHHCSSSGSGKNSGSGGSGGGGSGGSCSAAGCAAAQQSAPPGARASSVHHTRTGSNCCSMAHLPEESPLSDAALRCLDFSLPPSLLGVSHHTHIGLAVPLSRTTAAAAAAAAGGGSGSADGSAPVSGGGSASVTGTAASAAGMSGFGAGARAASCTPSMSSSMLEPPLSQQQQQQQQQPAQIVLSGGSSGSELAPLCDASLLTVVAGASASEHSSTGRAAGAAGAGGDLAPIGTGPPPNTSLHMGTAAAPKAAADTQPALSKAADKATFQPEVLGGGAGGGAIVSLSPAATDCLLALGLGPRLAGITDGCSGGGPGCGLARMLAGFGAGWLDVAGGTTVCSEDPGAAGLGQRGLAGVPVVCRLVQGPDGAPRYKLDEDAIRRAQPSLVVVACDEEEEEEGVVVDAAAVGRWDQQEGQQQQQQAQGAGRSAGGGSGGSGGGGGASVATAPEPGMSQMTGVATSGACCAAAAPGRVRLDVAVVQRVLQRAGVLWPTQRAAVLYQRCHSLAEVLEFVSVLATAAGVPERGEALVRGLRAALRAAACGVRSADARLAAAGAAAAGAAPVVAVLAGLAPPRLAGAWVPELLALAGARSAPGWPSPAEPPANLSWPALRCAAPAVLLLCLPGLAAHDAAAGLAVLAALPGFWSLPAVRAGRVFVVDQELLCRPGPRLVLGAALLAHLVDPATVQLPAALPPGAVLRLRLAGGQRCRSRRVPNYAERYC